MTVTVARDGAIFGEYEEAAFEAAIRSRELLPSDDYWMEGMADWDAVQNYAARGGLGGHSVMARTVKLKPPPSTPFAAAPVAIRTAAIPPQRTARVLEAVVALVLAAFAPLLWKPLLVLSLGLIAGALVVGVIAMRRNSARTGVMLIVGCAVAMLVACALATMAPALFG